MKLKRMKKIVLLFLFVVNLVSTQETTLYDSIIKSSNTFKKDSLKIDFLHKTFFKYCYSKPELSKKVAQKSLDISTTIDDKYLIVRSYLRRGIYYDITGKRDSALADYSKGLDITITTKDLNGEASIYNNTALIYWNDENFDEAMHYNLKSLKIFEKLKDKNGQASNLNNIGLLLSSLGRLEESNAYHKRSIVLKKAIKDNYGLGASYSNLSKNFTLLKQLDSGMYYNRKAIKTKKESNDLRGLGIAYNHLASDFRMLKQLDSALYYYKVADTIYKNMNAKRLRATNANNMAKIYDSLGQFSKALKTYQLSYNNLSDRETRTKLSVVSRMANSYVALNDYKNATIHYKEALVLSDSLRKQRDFVETQEVFEKYQSTEKEKEILTQRVELAEQKLDLSTKTYQIYGLGILAVVLGLIGYLLYNQQKLKNNQLKKENELKDALIKIETQNRLQEQRLRISRDLHDNIGAQLTFIISSIDNLKYGFKLEDEKLNTKLTGISAFAKETIYELRDTIWAMNKNEITVGDLQSRISNFIEKADIASSNINFIFNADNVVKKETKLSSVEGMNLYRILQEALNNALKYAEASEISVNISQLENKFKVVIKDNGKGFDIAKESEGNGLNNMKKRALDINAELVITSIKNESTTVTVLKPMYN